MSQEIFKRYEKKYLIDKEQYTGLRSILNQYMEEDQYGVYTIGNIYYDTKQYDLIRNSLDKPLYKEKFRVRSYGTPGVNDKVFLEIKKKYDGIVYKRRVEIPFAQAKEKLGKHMEEECENQILQEIQWFFKMYHPDPKVYIAYDRLALFGVADQNLRVTFDWNIRWRKKDLDLAMGDYGDPIIDPSMTLMEIKIPGTMPMWMASALTELKIYPISFSKYGMCYSGHLANEMMQLPEQITINNQQIANYQQPGYNNGGKKQCLAVS